MTIYLLYKYQNIGFFNDVKLIGVFTNKELAENELIKLEIKETDGWARFDIDEMQSDVIT